MRVDAVHIDGLLRVGADAVAAACRSAAMVERFDPLLGDIELATGLGIHPNKTKLVPAVCKADLPTIASALRGRFAVSAPRFALVALPPKVRILGFVVGPEAAGDSWSDPLEKFRRRVAEIGAWEMPLSLAALFYEQIALSI